MLTNLVTVRCECANQFNLTQGLGFELPEDWKQEANRIACPTDGCKATAGYRIGELVIVQYRSRVYVGAGLMLFACNQCRCRYDMGRGWPLVAAVDVAAVGAVGVQ